MWNLEYELIAILLLSAVIGLIMGRFLCKSKESEEKSKNLRLLRSHKALEVEFNKSQNRLNEQISTNHTYEDALSEQKQSISNLTTRLNSSSKHEAIHLEELKVLEKYKTRYEALNKEFGLQSELVEKLKNEKSSKIETIDGLKTDGSTLEHNLSSLQDKHKNTLIELEQLDFVSQKQKKQIDELLIRENELTEKLKNSKIKKKERLDFLEKEYEKVSSLLNSTIDERDDLISRIRAISSVVGAVGVAKE
jgi:DNA repair exonuclease SbcCD ATPase subunit